MVLSYPYVERRRTVRNTQGVTEFRILYPVTALQIKEKKEPASSGGGAPWRDVLLLVVMVMVLGAALMLTYPSVSNSSRQQKLTRPYAPADYAWKGYHRVSQQQANA